jgi:hypothetical protein
VCGIIYFVQGEEDLEKGSDFADLCHASYKKEILGSV